MKNISDIYLSELPYFKDINGDLTVMQINTHVPFKIVKRVFVVRANKGSIRGKHAHIKCNQFLTCPHGILNVICDDGVSKKTFCLNNPKLGLLIPAGIWAEQHYLKFGSVLTVLCDRVYEPKDYINNYKDFLNFKKK